MLPAEVQVGVGDGLDRPSPPLPAGRGATAAGEVAVAFVVNPILLGLPTGAAVAGLAHGGRMLGRLTPFWYVGSLLLVGALTAVTWGTPAATSTLVAALLLLTSVVMSVALLVPINNCARNWTAEDRPEDWREQHRRWDRLHRVRVAIIVVAFVLVLAATATL